MFKITPFATSISAFVIFITAMLAGRFIYTGSFHYKFLLWNLFLAWIPFQLSLFLTVKKKLSKIYSFFLLAFWLLFFPNALYIITDLIHLQQGSHEAPIWFDAILSFTTSITGLAMAFISLYKVESFLLLKFKQAVVKKLIIIFLFLGAFGVNLGRFWRWNSWDILSDPIRLFTQVISSFILPFQHNRTWVVTVLLTCLFSLLYFSIKKLPGLITEPGNKL